MSAGHGVKVAIKTEKVQILSPRPSPSRIPMLGAAVRMKSGNRACGCRLFLVIRKTAPPLIICGGQYLRAKKKRSGTHADALIAKTPRTLLDLTTRTLPKSAGALMELSKYVPSLEQGALC